MALTVTDVDKVATPLTGGLKMRIVQLSENSYPTGGSAITPAMFGMTTLLNVIVNASLGGRVFAWDNVANKIKALEDNGAAGAFRETPNATDLSANPVRALVIGS